jgi:glycosyltransferase involved in cell wall biosynthesis
LHSLQSQTLRDFEVLVIDDGSTDGGGVLAGQFEDTRFRVIAQQNGGVAVARNRGIAEARADLIAFLDSDDEWHPCFLEAVLDLSRDFPSAGIFATGFRRCYGAVKPDRQTSVRTPDGNRVLLIDDYFRFACGEDFISASSVAVRKSVFNKVGRFSVGAVIGEDRDLWARIACQYSIAYDTRILANYHIDAAGRSFDRWNADLPYPPVLMTVRKMLKDGAVSAALTRQVSAYGDWVLAQYLYGLVGLGLGLRAKQVLSHADFNTPHYRIEAVVLRLAIQLLPLRVIAALRDRWEKCAVHVRLFKFACLVKLRVQRAPMPVTSQFVRDPVPAGSEKQF